MAIKQNKVLLPNPILEGTKLKVTTECGEKEFDVKHTPCCVEEYSYRIYDEMIDGIDYFKIELIEPRITNDCKIPSCQDITYTINGQTFDDVWTVVKEGADITERITTLCCGCGCPAIITYKGVNGFYNEFEFKTDRRSECERNIRIASSIDGITWNDYIVYNTSINNIIRLSKDFYFFKWEIDCEINGCNTKPICKLNFKIEKEPEPWRCAKNSVWTQWVSDEEKGEYLELVYNRGLNIPVFNIGIFDINGGLLEIVNVSQMNGWLTGQNILYKRLSNNVIGEDRIEIRLLGNAETVLCNYFECTKPECFNICERVQTGLNNPDEGTITKVRKHKVPRGTRVGLSFIPFLRGDDMCTIIKVNGVYKIVAASNPGNIGKTITPNNMNNPLFIPVINQPITSSNVMPTDWPTLPKYPMFTETPPQVGNSYRQPEPTQYGLDGHPQGQWGYSFNYCFNSSTEDDFIYIVVRPGRSLNGETENSLWRYYLNCCNDECKQALENGVTGKLTDGNLLWYKHELYCLDGTLNREEKGFLFNGYLSIDKNKEDRCFYPSGCKGKLKLYFRDDPLGNNPNRWLLIKDWDYTFAGSDGILDRRTIRFSIQEREILNSAELRTLNLVEGDNREWKLEFEGEYEFCCEKFKKKTILNGIIEWQLTRSYIECRSTIPPGSWRAPWEPV